MITVVFFIQKELLKGMDPLGMAMYSISVLPLINALHASQIYQVWLANDATAGGSINGPDACTEK